MSIRSRLKIIISLIFTLVAAVCLGVATLNSAYAQPSTTAIQAGIYTPTDYMQYYKLTAPVDVASDDNYFCIAESKRICIYDKTAQKWIGPTDGQSLDKNGFVWQQDDYKIKQIELKNGNLFIRDENFHLYVFNVATQTYTDTNLNCNYFSVNDTYLAIGMEGSVEVYTYTFENGFSKTGVNVGNTVIAGTANKAPVYISNDNLLYCFSNDGTMTVKRYSLVDGYFGNIITYTPHFESISNTDLSSTYITANENTLIMTVSTKPEKLFTITMDDNNGSNYSEKQIVESGGVFSLLVKPQGLVIDNGILMIADEGSNAVKGYNLNDYSFANISITTEVEHSSRLTDQVQDIDTYGEYRYVLDQTRVLTVKDGKMVKELKLATLLNYVPKKIVVGEKYILLSQENNYTFIDKKTNEIVKEETSTTTGNLDIDYIDGKYYVLRKSYVVAISIFDENTLTLLEDKIVDSYSQAFTVDLDGNIYVYGADSTNKVLFVYNSNLNLTESTNLTFNVTKMQVDLAGNIYALTPDGELYIIPTPLSLFTAQEMAEPQLNAIQLNSNLPELAKCTSFAANFDNQNMYFTFNGYGFIAYSPSVISSTDRILIPDNLKLTDTNATDNLQFYTVAEKTKIHHFDLFKLDGTYFAYGGYTTSTGNDLYIKMGETDDFYVLLGQSTHLVKKSNATIVDNQNMFTQPDFTYVYTATSVNAYYYPKLVYTPTIDNPTVWEVSPFILIDTQRLAKGVLLKVEKEIAFNGMTFCYAIYQQGDNYVTAYVPKNFTAQTLAEEFISQRYTTKKLLVKGGGTVIYKEPTADESQELHTIHTGCTVKVFSDDGKFALVEHTCGDGAFIGYVKSNRISNPGANATRNTIIFILLATSIAVTSIYFVYRFTNRKSEQ